MIKFIFWFCVFAAVGAMVQTIRHPPKTEPQNETWIKGEVIKMIDEKLQIYKNAVDEFIKRHPEFNEELKEIIKQEAED